MVAVTVFLAATLLFIGLFNQTISTAVTYQRHRALATKASDLLDGILLSPGNPQNWSFLDGYPTGFGLQDPEFTQYRLSPYSLMRLNSATGTPVYYPRVNTTYSNITMGFGNYLLVPNSQALNYSFVSKLLGINGTYGFQLTISPIVTVAISKISNGAPLKFAINVAGSGFPLANAPISYCFLQVTAGVDEYPAFTVVNNMTYTNEAGSTVLTFPGVDGETSSYALIVYAHLSGLMGVGYYTHSTQLSEYVVPLVDSFENRSVLIVHGWSIGEPPEDASHSALFFNSTFVIMTEDFTLRESPLNSSEGTGKVVYGSGSEKDYAPLTIPTYNPGILITTYRKGGTYGAVLMPWGISSLAFPVVFGGDASQQEWVATDMRQVTVGGIAYQAQIAVWSLEGYQVKG
jgi:hypothetical protein